VDAFIALSCAWQCLPCARTEFYTLRFFHHHGVIDPAFE
jgi:hypothetical protein